MVATEVIDARLEGRIARAAARSNRLRSRRVTMARRHHNVTLSGPETMCHPLSGGAIVGDSAQLRRLVAYNQWANEKILTAIDGMTAQDLARPVDAYIGNLAKNLHHVRWATRLWLARWKGIAPPAAGEPSGSWADAYAETHAELREFVESLTDAEADRVVHYKDTKGNPYQLPLGQLITHVVNHGTHHRAETGMLLERLGRSPGDMDYVYYCLGRR
jgi:uncharacterized damage-inducible protein DinB